MYLKVIPYEVPILVIITLVIPTLGDLILAVFKVKPNKSKNFDRF